MTITDILGVIGGLSLFLYGMNMMSHGLEHLAGDHLEKILMRLTDHKIKAVLVGTIATACMQSSSAMTVMLIGFLNAHILPLENAIWVVMGANIGTTMTGQMLAFHIGAWAPLFAFIGVIFGFFRWFENIGEAIGGIGILFMGLEMMSLSLMPLKESLFFMQLLQSISHPLLGILVGAFVTALIQSSSASIGILQSLASLGLISFKQATFMIFGFDIGTCVTALLASVSGSHASKQLALFHVLLNVFGTVIFTIIALLTPFIDIVARLSPQHITNQLANMHTIFNIGTTLFVLCIDHLFIQWITFLCPDKNCVSKGEIR